MVGEITPTQAQENKEMFQGLLEIDKKERTFKVRQGYVMAYIWSVLIPPIGIYYLVKYIFFADGTQEDLKAGIISFVLTIISLVLSIALMGFLFKQTTSAIPASGGDMMKELITPGNDKTLKNLYQ